jgi:hypothetical protein
MSTSLGTPIADDDPFTARWAWKGGAVAGVAAAAVMGVLIVVMNLPLLRQSIAGLYGLEGSVVAGWIAHLTHGAIFGALFAAILTDPALSRVTNHVWRTAAAGLIYGIVLAVAAAGIIMPIWLGAVGIEAPGIPNVSQATLFWHAVYGVVLGIVFPLTLDW